MVGRPAGVVALTALALALLASAPSDARAQAAIDLEVMVSLISDEPGKIDPRAEELDRKLGKKIRYESIEVLDVKRMRLAIDDVGSVSLPDGTGIYIKPLVLDERGALIHVEWAARMDTQLRVKSGQLVVLGPQRHGPDQIVVSLKSRF